MPNEYSIKLNDFEGPLDLLLFFIKRDELDIYDIPIARITKEFLGYVNFMKDLDLEIAGEFVVMAAELMQIKVRMLLPPEGNPADDEDTDPRADLVKRLVEYKRFKEVSDGMRVLETEAALLAPRGYRSADEVRYPQDSTDDLVKDVSLFDLIGSFQFAIDRMPKRQVHEIVRINVTIDEMIDHIHQIFAKRSEITFGELVAEFRDRIRLVVTFLAILEVVRSRVIIVRQFEPFGELSLVKNVA